MSFTNPIFGLSILVEATLIGWLLARLAGGPADGQRVSSLDGLRGYAACAVICHHGAIWFHYLQTGRWELLDSSVYNEFGEASVSLFFMITGFLFSKKAILPPPFRTDWLHIATSRVLRLTPLYLAMTVLLLLTVATRSGFRLLESPFALTKHIIAALTFGFITPFINQQADTSTMTAGVLWTLAWEWKFYAALPVLAWLQEFGRRWRWLWWGLLPVLLALIVDEKIMRLFVAGYAAALLGRSPEFVAFARSRVATVLVVVVLLATFAAFREAYSLPPFILLTVAFCLIGNGNTLFGLLTTSGARVLGDISYSIYLLHGLALYTLFRFIITPDQIAGHGPAQHWIDVALAMPVLLTIALATFTFIESPALRQTNNLSRRFRLLFMGAERGRS